MSTQLAMISGFLLASVSMGLSANIASDQAGNYDTGLHPWNSGSNQGTGFGNWYLGTWGTTAGHFLGSAIDNGFIPSGGAINTTGPFGSDQSFGLYSGADGGALVGREFTGGGLNQNQTFKLRLDNGWVDGFFGWHLETANGGVDGTSLFHWHRGNSGNYLYSSGANDNIDSGIAWTDAGLSFEFAYRGSTNYDLTVYSYNAAGGIAATNTFSGYLKENQSLGQFRVYSGAGNGANYNLFINSMEVSAVPEPGTLALLGLALAGGLWVHRRKK